ncbi:oxysterol-binding protein, putative [Entamoeba invadens IP1]|uniref:Oxysterol-binding protein, putative n=1 Tax=Entamoeba invadens TaxID=33085 RepID=S0B5D4_ENTIV|nr:oxysterol-binding protein, putative [Entamoeba invadens IP1]ELP93853.1 oxysterol-binding protein, putative [Entamoeba invadens IP1]BAN41791.1 oxysterol-binding protein, putative [Entamoeba invadens]|eukprot:XP_004260624.1 oxysterol-binding protein, putative [Entamoeba invadens IP1]
MSKPLTAEQQAIKGKFSKNNLTHEFKTQNAPTPYKEVIAEPLAQDLWNNNIIWEFVKGLSPGVDLTRIPFPVCITQARSFLESFTDYFKHWTYLSQAANEDDPYKRMKLITLWYLTGFSNAMKLVRKPYNPILGEVFRCMWADPKTSAKTFYVSEQVSHHPPISSFYLTNPQDGWSSSGTVSFSVSFYGVSAWANLNGTQKIKLLKYDEEYTWVFPPTKASGFFIGPFIMEMGGNVQIKSNKTPFWADLNFLTTSMWSSSNYHKVNGQIKDGDKIIDTIAGNYFESVTINNDVFFEIAKLDTDAPKRFEVPKESLWGRESQKVWEDLTKAVIKGDGKDAADKKYEVEEWQRIERTENPSFGEKFVPLLFAKQGDGDYRYKYETERMLSNDEDVIEQGGVISIQKKTD